MYVRLMARLGEKRQLRDIEGEESQQLSNINGRSNKLEIWQGSCPTLQYFKNGNIEAYGLCIHIIAFYFSNVVIHNGNFYISRDWNEFKY